MGIASKGPVTGIVVKTRAAVDDVLSKLRAEGRAEVGENVIEIMTKLGGAAILRVLKKAVAGLIAEVRADAAEMFANLRTDRRKVDRLRPRGWRVLG